MEALLALCSFYSLTPVPYLLVGAICRAREERGQGDAENRMIEAALRASLWNPGSVLGSLVIWVFVFRSLGWG